MTATQVYAILNKKFKGLESGVDHVEVDGTKLIFYFVNNTSAEMQFPDPAGIESMVIRTVNGVPHLICILSDSTEIDAGVLPSGTSSGIWIGTNPPTDPSYNAWINPDEDAGGGGGVLSEAITATEAIGSVTKGKVYAAGTPLETIIRDILVGYTAPKITLSYTPNQLIFDAVEDNLSTFTTSAVVTKGTNNITSVKFFIDGVETKSITTGVADGGTYSDAHTFSPVVNTTFTVKVTVNDGKQNTTKTQDVVFIGKSYYGTLPDAIEAPTEAIIKGLEFNTLKNSKNLVYSNIIVDYGRVFYAYPKSLGALTKILDADGRDYIGSYTKSEVTVDGIEYYCYMLTDSMGTSGAYQKFQ